MIAVALDPSLRSTGVAVFDLQTRLLRLSLLKYTAFDHTFPGIIRAAADQVRQIKELIAGRKVLSVIQEGPPPAQSSSDTLYGIGAYMAAIWASLDFPLHLAHPTLLKTLAGVKKLEKEHTRKLLLDLIELNDLQVECESNRRPQKWKSDICDAAVLCLYWVYNAHGIDICLPERIDPGKWLLRSW